LSLLLSVSVSLRGLGLKIDPKKPVNISISLHNITCAATLQFVLHLLAPEVVTSGCAKGESPFEGAG